MFRMPSSNILLLDQENNKIFFKTCREPLLRSLERPADLRHEDENLSNGWGATYQNIRKERRWWGPGQTEAVLQDIKLCNHHAFSVIFLKSIEKYLTNCWSMNQCVPRKAFLFNSFLSIYLTWNSHINIAVNICWSLDRRGGSLKQDACDPHLHCRVLIQQTQRTKFSPCAPAGKEPKALHPKRLQRKRFIVLTE